MSGQAAEPRLTVDLPVRIWGMSAQGRPFSQHVRAQNISHEGALLNNVESELKVGDVIGVQFEDKKARCSVIWAMNTGSMKKNQVGIRLLTDQECPWEKQLPEGAVSAVSDSNRRRYHRHKISMPIEIRDERVQAPTRINATDVSGNGCYIETMMPMPVGTVLRIDIWIDADRITASAVVRTSDPGVGNGIEFTGLPADGKVKLQKYLDAIDPQRGISEPEGSEF
ncbi:MAG TPA: PilZ domain-containing protein [Terriglobales bacterium]|nr:PilZ domain-containing protein [Terriglobales bacterium]